MKKYIYGIMAMIAGAVAFIACEDDIDEVAQWNRVVDNSSDIAGLKSACDKINYNVSSFTKIVEAQNKNLFISAAYPNEDGYLIVFSDGSFAQLLNGKDGVDGKDGADGKDGKDGVDGKDGKDGYVPAIAIKKDTDGIYYWTCDGAFMFDETGSKVPAQGKDGVNGTNGANGLVAQFTVSEAGELLYRYSDTDAWTSLGNVKGADGVNGADGINGTNGTNGADGKTPTFKIVEGNLLVSYDGVNWKDLGNVKGADGANGTNGTDGINGTNGKDGITPEFMIQDGKWFVTYNNKYTWVELGQATGDKGADGKDGVDGKDGINGTNGKDGVDGKDGINGTNGTNGKDGITPKLKIVDGYWYISYDGGKTYETEPLGKATGDKGADGKDGVNGTNGTNGKDGVDGKTPTFKLEGGALFVSYDSKTWTSLGIVKGADGKDGVNGTNGTNGAAGKDGVTPKMKITDGYWYVSYDNGTTWTKLDKATGANGANGTNGTDGITPTFKVEGGNLYVSYNEGASWSNLGNVKGADGVNGTNGTNGTAGKDGVSPKFKITDGYWYVSYDNGTTWTKLDKATGENGKDGVSPELSINSEGHLISTVNGVATDLGNVTGATPVIKVEDGKWKVSTDGGTTWTEIAGSSTVGGGTAGYTSLGAPISGYVDGYAYVDLGLPSGKKWATANVGAINEADYGLYFWWGDVIGYDRNTEHDFSSANADTNGKSVAQLQSAGIIGTDKNLVAERDAATQQWSENWKMPTKADFDELLSECRWTWVSYGTANGYKVESKKAGNNNWIFLPAAGNRSGTSSRDVGSNGNYWSSTVLESSSSGAYILYFFSASKSTNNGLRPRYDGRTVRPVCE